MEKLLYVCPNSRNNIDEHEGHDPYEEDVENRHDDICRCIFDSDPMLGITFSRLTPIMDLRSDTLARLQEYISTDEDDEEKRQKVIERIDDQCDRSIGDNFLPEDFTEDERQHRLESDHRSKYNSLYDIKMIVKSKKYLKIKK